MLLVWRAGLERWSGDLVWGCVSVALRPSAWYSGVLRRRSGSLQAAGVLGGLVCLVSRLAQPKEVPVDELVHCKTPRQDPQTRPPLSSHHRAEDQPPGGARPQVS